MILVTGANGFIGRHVARCLAEDCRAFDVVFADDFAVSCPGAEKVQGDLLDRESLLAALEGVTTVVHLASKHVDHDGSGFEKINVEGTRALCSAAAEAGVERFIYLSSVGVYGHGAHREADETTPLAPDTPFSRSKAAAEKIVLDHAAAGDFPAVVLRHRFVYGEGDGAVLPRLIKAARSYPVWLSGGQARISWIWAPDLARIIQRLAEIDFSTLDTAAPIYHVTDGEPVSYRHVITTICKAFGYKPPRISVPYMLLYAPIRLRELLFGIDPEVASSPLTSIRLQLVAQDNDFSNRKLAGVLPDFKYTSFADGFEQSLAFYEQFS